MAADAVRELKKSLEAISEGDGEFFDRREEMASLLTQIEMGLNRIAVVIGPNNSGKTALLKELQRVWDATPEVKAMLPMFYIDMRSLDHSSPELAAAQIAKQFRSWASWLKGLGAVFLKTIGGMDLSRVAFKGVNVDASRLAELLDNEPGNDLTRVMSWFDSLATENPDRRPIFILDEADRLKSWSEKDVATLLGGFVAMTKQNRSAVIILSTSDDLFRQWFQTYVNGPQWKPVPVGHFDEVKAKMFLSKLVEKQLALGRVAPDSWSEQEVFETCGGCPQLIQSCVLDVFAEGKAPADVLNGMVDAEVGTVFRGLAEGQGYDVPKFEEVMKMIVSDRAVGLGKVCRLVYNKNTSECLNEIQAMLAANVIHVRYMPHGVEYGDLERGRSEEIVFLMARSPAHHVAMKRYCSGELLDESDE